VWLGNEESERFEERKCPYVYFFAAWRFDRRAGGALAAFFAGADFFLGAVFLAAGLACVVTSHATASERST